MREEQVIKVSYRARDRSGVRVDFFYEAKSWILYGNGGLSATSTSGKVKALVVKSKSRVATWLRPEGR
jgi:hypothetical protein